MCDNPDSIIVLRPLTSSKWVSYSCTLARGVIRRRCSGQSLQEQPQYIPPLRYKVVTCAHLGRIDEARVSLRHLLNSFPALTIANLWTNAPAWGSAETREAVVAGFRKTGLPEE